ncbi:MAG: addiction module antidote protein, HigA family [Gammaproteobacteria bacterium]|nr:MAG: addiction module antidote protein, HigA family [Gammaproteobacteria bacterium]UTW44043.1 HigA family addiction module antidote protein [bacterium SCSIO 12844]
MFAKHLGWTYPRINEIVNGKRGITPDTALAFAEAFEMEVEFWINLQSAYDLWHAKQKHKKSKPLKVLTEA